MTYEELLIEADEQDLIVREKEISGFGGRIYRKLLSTAECQLKLKKLVPLLRSLGTTTPR